MLRLILFFTLFTSGSNLAGFYLTLHPTANHVCCRKQILLDLEHSCGTLALSIKAMKNSSSWTKREILPRDLGDESHGN